MYLYNTEYNTMVYPSFTFTFTFRAFSRHFYPKQLTKSTFVEGYIHVNLCPPLSNVYSCLGKESQQEVEELLRRQPAVDCAPDTGAPGVWWPRPPQLSTR